VLELLIIINSQSLLVFLIPQEGSAAYQSLLELTGNKSSNRNWQLASKFANPQWFSILTPSQTIFLWTVEINIDLDQQKSLSSSILTIIGQLPRHMHHSDTVMRIHTSLVDIIFTAAEEGSHKQCPMLGYCQMPWNPPPPKHNTGSRKLNLLKSDSNGERWKPPKLGAFVASS